MKGNPTRSGINTSPFIATVSCTKYIVARSPLTPIDSLAGPCRDLWGGRCSKYKRGTWNTAFNRAVLLADMCIEMDASVLIKQQMP